MYVLDWSQERLNRMLVREFPYTLIQFTDPLLNQQYYNLYNLISPYFNDIYLYLAQNKLPSTKSATCKVETLAEKYILLDSLLFKLLITPEKNSNNYSRRYVHIRSLCFIIPVYSQDFKA